MKSNPGQNLTLPISAEDSGTQIAIKITINVLLASAIAGIVSFLIYLDSDLATGFSERSFTEYGQEAFLLISSIIYALTAFKHPKEKGFALFMAFVAGFAFIVNSITA